MEEMVKGVRGLIESDDSDSIWKGSHECSANDARESDNVNVSSLSGCARLSFREEKQLERRFMWGTKDKVDCVWAKALKRCGVQGRTTTGTGQTLHSYSIESLNARLFWALELFWEFYNSRSGDSEESSYRVCGSLEILELQKFRIAGNQWWVKRIRVSLNVVKNSTTNSN